MSDKLPPRILIVEPDEVLNISLGNAIERYWFDVSRVKTADEALRLAEIAPPHVAIISPDIKDLEAKQLVTKLQEQNEDRFLPIIFLVNKEDSEANYLENDNDLVEVLFKPYSPDELMKTIRTLLRKSKPIFQDRIIKAGDISMDLSTYKVFRAYKEAHKEVHLGPTEFKILQLFVQKPNYIFSRRQIIDYVWGTDKDIAPRTIDVHVNRIRSLIKLDNDDKQLIRTVRSAGYSLI